MANVSNDGYSAGLLPTYNIRGQPPGARIRQAYVEDAEDIEHADEARYSFEPRENQVAPTESLEWHGIELTPMFGAVLLCTPFALWAIWAAL